MVGGFRVALSADGKLLAGTRATTAYVWDMASGKLVRIRNIQMLHGALREEARSRNGSARRSHR